MIVSIEAFAISPLATWSSMGPTGGSAVGGGHQDRPLLVTCQHELVQVFLAGGAVDAIEERHLASFRASNRFHEI
ncbi:hypothetical protein [Sinorhizobium meliloti]|uniref:hypothetical protein n=1 Tax=Rhizobium meliloti TaxID=382 RepID=UPI00031DFF0A|nr:hypothetical protein [Sinorhizobium meliloti]MBP2466380.1 hypothetical protein [Sinorhizobium meliloti]MCO6422719.1 hypothetical protein [Sinorhizobium meliloti]MDE3790101.1 hypothetical protein [Sinorhizobium meliloti]MDE4558938.1 hypothetical protein [Sinorhizobium meliloti SM11]MDE4593099.1 hypothetical protein [Sinorhizobium meliloti]